MTLTIGKKDRTNKARDEKSAIITINMGNYHWTREEINIIKKHFKVIPDEEIANKLLGRTVLAISQKRRNLGLKYTQEWMNEQIRKQISSSPSFC